ncbi:Gfo/Idh/MocA family oxidoreductase [Deinococcus sp. KSM4-11]|uniref:Gfo/Idh/MocA family protein n=1 Tax=Deinococcus sp. KSM4-11 TaxID=2568654 RepID=UPI0010A39BEF|nr:Gfo/Idh/MocA family oxidoreductase [Deinococcus sp. KSM4-11]THF88038.1 Gfo/Idh/MocA family oxidoreductase [Deinococcus sp. KSM4-11]
MTAPALEPSVPPERPVRAVMVGCGGMSATWLRAAAAVDGLEVVGLVDLQEAAAVARQTEFELTQARTGTDLDAVLAQTRPDLIFDCTIPEAHHATALTAFAHGVGVLGEKPLADTLERAQEMVRAGQQAGLFHAVIQNRRYDPNIRRVRSFVAGGRMGDLTAVHADFFIGAHFGGFRDAMQHVLLLDMTIHTFDAARLICGQDPVRVHCHEWNPQGSWYAHGANAVATFEMTGGVVITYRGSWCAEGFPTTWESDWRITGTQGTVRWDGGDHPRAALVRTTGGFFSEFEELDLPPVEPTARIGGHEGLIRDAVDVLRHGGTPETVASDNIKSLAMVLAAIESAESGQTVDVKW